MSAIIASRWVRALGTTATVFVADSRALPRAVAELERELERIDLACSRFRPDSDLSRLNAAGGRALRVRPGLIEAVLVALRMASVTRGAVDPTIGRAMRGIGYDRDFDRGLRAPARRAPHPAPGPRAVVVDPHASTIALAPGAELDLGATAKALAADRAAQAAHDATGGGVLVNLGGDVSVVGSPPSGGWRVGLGDDHAAAGPHRSVVSVGSGGLATSSTRVRRWDGVHHIVDPRTGLSADEVWRTATVAAGSCVDANAASTAAIVLGRAAPGWLSRLGLPGRLVRADGTVVRVAGWPSEPAP